MTPRQEAEAGVIATQLAVVLPAVLLLVMLTVQFALWAHATQLADAAADAAASTAALPGATPGDGEAAARGLLRQAGHLTDVTVDQTRNARQSIATVTGVAPHVVPGLRWSVTARAAAPVEMFVPEGDR